jgi:hypothetical protein
MPFTRTSLAMVWLITVALFALTGSGAVGGWWVLLVVLVALAAPALMLRSPSPERVTTPLYERARIVSDARDRSPLDHVNIEDLVDV